MVRHDAAPGAMVHCPNRRAAQTTRKRFKWCRRGPFFPSLLSGSATWGWKHFENSTSQFTHRFLNFKNPWRRM